MTNLDKAVVLVVDDEQAYLSIITKTLKERNYKILQALNGKMGYKVAQSFLPDIIIADWEMPEMNGIELICELKNNNLTRDIPIIMCTGKMTSSENLDTALNAGAIDFLRKPVDPIELVARVQSALKLSGSFRQIKELNATKDKFFSIIAHDLKGPFNTLIGFSRMLLDNYHEINDEKRTEYIGYINNSSEQGFQLLLNLLEWSCSQTNRIKINPIEFDLGNLVDSIIELLAPSASKKGIHLKNNIQTPICPFADKDMISTVIRNLVSNAIKYSNPGGIIAISSQIADYMANVYVSDTGIGIPETNLNKLFRIDQNSSTPGTQKEKGTGLGLILCKEFVEKNGGKIWVESEEGEGSKFSFTLPLSKA